MTSQKWDGGRQVAAVGRQYAQIAVSQAAAPLAAAGGAGQAGDSLDYLWIFPTTTTPGAVTLFDGGAAVWAWPAGLTLSDLRPIYVPLNLRSVNGPWRVTTPANATALGAGIFS